MAANISTIGSSGRDYSTLLSWEEGTDNDLVTATASEFGEVYDDSTFSEAAINIAGATTNTTYNRSLYAASVSRYDPAASSGVLYDVTAGSWAIQFNENYWSIGSGIAVTFAVTGTGTIRPFFTNISTSGLINGLYTAIHRTSTAAIDAVVLKATNRCWNSIVVGKAGSTGTIEKCGRSWDSDMEFYNCIFYGTEDAGWSARANGNTNLRLQNVISLANSAFDFEWKSATYSEKDYNMSQDTTADGSNSVTGADPSIIFNDGNNDDFTLIAGCSAISAGIDKSALFINDYFLDTRTAWDMGAIKFTAAAAQGIVQYLLLIT